MPIPGEFVPIDVSTKLAIAVGIGMLVGLEREWSQKDLGTRTFAITAMAGALSILAAPGLTYLSFAGVLLIVMLAGARNVRDGKPVETTTFAAVTLTFVLGVLVGQGHHYTPIAAAVVMTLLLSMKPALAQFSGGLTIAEVRSAVLLGLLAFVIYPILPNRAIDPWGLVNPREAWLTVILIAALGFVNYVLLKVFHSRGLYYTAILGGMVNSTATIAELTVFLSNPETDALAIVIDLLTVVAMFGRNLLILALFARSAGPAAAGPLIVMGLVSLLVMRQQQKRFQHRIGELKLSSPLSLMKVLKFGLLFLAIEIVGDLGQRYFGHLGFLVVSVLGGLVSSASTSGAAATLALHGKISAQTAGLATVLTSMTSALSNLPIIHQEVRRWELTRKLVIVSSAVVIAGVLTMLGMHWL
jgi:uncharacterized membrane protein (DUF4010 family)